MAQATSSRWRLVALMQDAQVAQIARVVLPTLAAVAMLAGLLAPRPAQAQTPLPVVPRPAPPAEPATAPRPIDLTAPPRPALPPREGASVRVERFIVSGATRVPGDDIAAVLKPFERRTLSFGELAAAADAVTGLYRRRGWLLALAYLPEQQIREGVVEIAVLEGRLGTLSLGAAPEGTDRPLAAAIAQWGIDSGDVVGEANLVRNLLVLNEWAGIAVGADVRPGRDVGTADVTVALREAGPRTSATLSIDSLGSKATGRVRVGASGSVRGLAGRGDVLGAQLLAGVEGGLTSMALSYAFTPHPSGTRLGLSVSHLRYKLVEQAFKPLQAEGDATYLQATLEQPLLRRVGHAVTLRTRLVARQLRDAVEAFAQHEDRHVEQAFFGLRGEHGAPGVASTTWSLGLTAGRLGFDDAVARAADRVLRQTAGRFGRINLDLTHEHPLSDRSMLVGRVVAQQALRRNLDAAERVVLGGAGALRPYGELATQADHAVQASVEARHRIALAGVPATLLAFVDMGHGRAEARPTGGDNRIRARALGVATELQLPADTTLRLAAMRQRMDPAPPGASDRATHGWVELLKSVTY